MARPTSSTATTASRAPRQSRRRPPPRRAAWPRSPSGEGCRPGQSRGRLLLHTASGAPRARDQLAVGPGRRSGDVRGGDLLLRCCWRSPRRRPPRGRRGRSPALCRRSPAASRVAFSAALRTALPATNVAQDAGVPVQSGGRVGVRVVVRDPVVGDAERLGDDLRLDRLRAVADVRRAGEDVDAPIRLILIHACDGSPFWFMPVGYSIAE